MGRVDPLATNGHVPLAHGAAAGRAHAEVCWSSDLCRGPESKQPIDNMIVILFLYGVLKETP